MKGKCQREKGGRRQRKENRNVGKGYWQGGYTQNGSCEENLGKRMEEENNGKNRQECWRDRNGWGVYIVAVVMGWVLKARRTTRRGSEDEEAKKKGTRQLNGYMAKKKCRQERK